jgi:hypothetical protein
MSQNFIHDDSGVVPYINLFDADSWNLTIGIKGGLEKKKDEGKNIPPRSLSSETHWLLTHPRPQYQSQLSDWIVVEL